MAGRALVDAAAGCTLGVLGYHKPQPGLAGGAGAEQEEGGMGRWALGTPSCWRWVLFHIS